MEKGLLIQSMCREEIRTAIFRVWENGVRAVGGTLDDAATPPAPQSQFEVLQVLGRIFINLSKDDPFGDARDSTIEEYVSLLTSDREHERDSIDSNGRLLPPPIRPDDDDVESNANTNANINANAMPMPMPLPMPMPMSRLRWLGRARSRR